MEYCQLFWSGMMVIFFIVLGLSHLQADRIRVAAYYAAKRRHHSKMRRVVRRKRSKRAPRGRRARENTS